MAAGLNQVLVSIGLDPDSMQAFLTNLSSQVTAAGAKSPVTVNVQSNAKEAAAEVTGSLGQVSSVSAQVGAAVSQAFAAASQAALTVKTQIDAITGSLVNLLKGALSEAGDDEKAASRLKATLGGLATQGEEFAAKFAQVNQSIRESDVQQAVSQYFNVGKSLGFADDQALKMSETIIELAGSIKKVTGDDFNTILDALRTQLLRGGASASEYGIRIKSVDVENQAAKLGFIQLGHELTQEELAISRLMLIQEQAATISGQATSATATYSSSLAALRIQFTQLFADVGKQLIGFVTPYIQYFTQIIGQVRAFVTEHSKIAGILALIAGAGVALGAVLGTLASAFALVGGVAAALVSVVTGVIAAWGAIEAGAIAVAGVLFTWPAVVIGTLVAAATAVAVLAAAFTAFVGGGALAGAVKGIYDFVTGSKAAAGVFAALKAAALTAFEGVKDAVGNIVEPVISFVTNIAASVQSVLEQNATGISTALREMGTEFKEVFDGVSGAIGAGISAVLNYVQPLITAVVPIFVTAFKAIPIAIQDVIDAFGPLVSFALDALGKITGSTFDVGSGFKTLQGVIVTAFSLINQLFESTTVVKVLAVIKGTITVLIALFAEFALDIKDGMSNAQLALAGVGTALGYILKGIGLFSSTAKEASINLLNFADQQRQEAKARLEKDIQDRRALEKAAQAQIAKDKDEFNNPQKAVDAYKAELALKAKAEDDARAKKDAERAAAKTGTGAAATGSQVSATGTSAASVNGVTASLDGATAAAARLDGGITKFTVDAKDADNTAKELKKTLEARDKSGKEAVAEEEKLAALRAETLDSLEAERAALAAKEEQALKEVTDAETIQNIKRKFAAEDSEIVVKYERKRAEETKKATDQAVEAEHALEEARAKSTEGIDDDIAALRKRQDAELAAAHSEEERAALRRKNLAQESQLIEEAARKQAETAKQAKAAAKGIDDFLKKAQDASDRKSGKGAEVDVREAGDKVRDQIDKVDSPESAAKLKKAAHLTVDNVTDGLLDEATKADDAAGKAHSDFAKKKRSGFKSTQERRDAQAEVDKADEEAKTKADAYNKAQDQAQTLKGDLDKEIDKKAKDKADKDAKAKADLAKQQADAANRANQVGPPGAPGQQPGDAVPGFGQQVPPGQAPAFPGPTVGPDGAPAEGAAGGGSSAGGGLLDQLSTALTTGLTALHDQVAKVLEKAQAMLDAANLLPDVVSGLSAMLDGQTALTTSLVAFGSTVVDKLTSQATLLNDLSKQVDDNTAALKALGGDPGNNQAQPDLSATGN